MIGVRSGSLVITAAVCAACATPTQAVVVVDIEDTLAPELARLSVDVLDENDHIEGKSTVFALRGREAVAAPFSFGAIPSSDLQLHVRFLGLDEAGQIVLEQHLLRDLTRGAITRVPFVLRAECLHVVGPCEAVDTTCPMSSADGAAPDCDAGPSVTASEPDAGQADALDTLSDAEMTLPTDADAGADAAVCVLGSTLDCGACGRICSLTHVNDAACVSATCTGSCQKGFDDCDSDLATNGCETDLRRDPRHCGGCEEKVHACPYAVCNQGLCATDVSGFPPARDADPTSHRWLGNRLFGTKVGVGRDGILAGIGVGVLGQGGQPDARFRLVVYSSDIQQMPDTIIDKTAEMTVRGLARDYSGMYSVYGGLEAPVAGLQSLRSGQIVWIFVIASDYMDLISDDADATWLVSTDEVSYLGVEQYLGRPNQESKLTRTTAPIGAIYLITTPP